MSSALAAIKTPTMSTPILVQVARLALSPPLCLASDLLVEILTESQTLKNKRYKGKCAVLAERCVLFLQQLEADMQNPLRLPADVSNTIKQVERILEQLIKDIAIVSSARFLPRIVPHKSKEAALSEYNAILDNTWRSFDHVSLKQMGQFIAQLVPPPGQHFESPTSQRIHITKNAGPITTRENKKTVPLKTPPDVPPKPLWLRCSAAGHTTTPPMSRDSSFHSECTLVSAMASDDALQKPITFCLNGEYAGFVNASLHSVVHEGNIYPTAEHLYQAHAFLHAGNVSLADHIRRQPTATEAIAAAELRHSDRRRDWTEVRFDIMDSVLEAKFAQHPALCAALLATGDKHLVYECPTDSFWGADPEGSGQNELGKALMRLREMVRLQPPTVLSPRSGDTWQGPIRFRPNGEYTEFLNSSPHVVTLDGKQYSTAEHLFQATRFKSAHLADLIWFQHTAFDAIQKADSMKDKQRRDWTKVRESVMDTVLEAKFTQHPDLRATLLATSERKLIYDCSSEEFWGVGGRGQGQNELGKALMRLRDMFRTRDERLGPRSI